MYRTIVGRSTCLALSTILPLWLLAAAAPSSAPGNLDSGIKGRVVLGPLTPSSRVGEKSPEQPFQTTLDIVNAEDESLVRQIRTRRNGMFVVGLPPGDYIVRSAPSDEFRQPSIDPVPVTVPAHTFVELTINADTGLR